MSSLIKFSKVDANIPQVPEVAACVSNKDDPTIACSSKYTSLSRIIESFTYQHSFPSMDLNDSLCYAFLWSQPVLRAAICTFDDTPEET